jgi:hypothetical protein
MKRDAFSCAFEGLESWSQFSYKKQLREAIDAVRQELDKTVHLYVSRFPTHNYRTLARQLHISPAKLCEILRPFPHGRKRGRPKPQRTAHPKRKDVEQALQALKRCVMDGRADNAGDDAYQNLTDWLEKWRYNETLLKRAGYLTQRYEALRSRGEAK